MLKIMGVLVMLTLVFGAVFGSAAALQVNGGTIQAGEDTDLVCDGIVNVAGWGLETDDGLVSFVRIHDIALGCVGCDIFVNITKAGVKIAGGSATIPTDQSAEDNDPATGEIGVKIKFTPQPAEDITDIKVWIEGPCNA